MGEDAGTPIVVMTDAKQLLLEDGIEAVVAAEDCRRSRTGGVRERQAGCVKSCVVEAAEVPPASEFQLAVQTRISLLGVPLKLGLVKGQRRIVD
ncbi:hypothetical protein XI06_17835, partial [Bradyrhizobium sp. CCBAU 11434]|nr:hypothetical protein [Bradyrhizobium sp. CCBAU 11434]